MQFMARVPHPQGYTMRAHWGLSLSEYMELPIRLRNAMLDHLNQWRLREDSGKKQAGG